MLDCVWIYKKRNSKNITLCIARYNEGVLAISKTNKIVKEITASPAWLCGYFMRFAQEINSISGYSVKIKLNKKRKKFEFFKMKKRIIKISTIYLFIFPLYCAFFLYNSVLDLCFMAIFIIYFTFIFSN